MFIQCAPKLNADCVVHACGRDVKVTVVEKITRVVAPASFPAHYDPKTGAPHGIPLFGLADWEQFIDGPRAMLVPTALVAFVRLHHPGCTWSVVSGGVLHAVTAKLVVVAILNLDLLDW